MQPSSRMHLIPCIYRILDKAIQMPFLTLPIYRVKCLPDPLEIKRYPMMIPNRERVHDIIKFSSESVVIIVNPKGNLCKIQTFKYIIDIGNYPIIRWLSLAISDLVMPRFIPVNCYLKMR